MIDRSSVSGPVSYGFYLYENENVNLMRSKVKAPDSSGEYGIYDYLSHSTIEKNKSNGGYYGIYVDEPLPGYELTQNTTNGNSSAGLYVCCNYPSTLYDAKLVQNTANNNGSYGFYADVSIGGKENHATGNGVNCFHVKCSH